MTADIGLLLGLLVVMAVLFFTEKLPIEVTAFGGLSVLVIAGFVAPAEAFTGFASPAVITMLSIFFLSGALVTTGVSDAIGVWVNRALGTREPVLIAAIMLSSGVMSAFMNNIAATAVLLPAVGSVARTTGVPGSRLFMPLAFGAVLGGTTTLVGTPPNILAGEFLRERGLEPFGFFDFTPVGVSLLAAGILYMLTVGRALLPKKDISNATGDSLELVDVYDLDERIFSVRIPVISRLDGLTLAEARLRMALGVVVLAILRDGTRTLAPAASTTLRGGDILHVKGRHADFRHLFQLRGLEAEEVGEEIAHVPTGVDAATVRLEDGCALLGRTLEAVDFRRHFGSSVVGVCRDEGIAVGNVGRTRLSLGDELIVVGAVESLDGMAVQPGIEIVERGKGPLARIQQKLFVLRVPEGSPLVGRSVRESRMRELVGLTIAGIDRAGETSLDVDPDARFEAENHLIVAGEADRLRAILDLGHVIVEEDPTSPVIESEDVRLVEATLAPRSHLTGRTLRELRFRERHGVQVLAIWREGRPIRTDVSSRRLRLGDALLLQGPRDRLSLLGSESGLVLLADPASEVRRTKKAPLTLLAFAAMIVLVVSGVQPIHTASFIAATFVLLTRAITMEEAYRAVEWRAIFLVAAILPVGIAMEQTGAAALVAGGVTSMSGVAGLSGVLVGFAVLASLLSQCLDGAPTVVLLAPIAMNVASELGISPYPLLLGVSLAASAAFMTPFSHKANLIVMGAGGYRVGDYVRVGTPLTIIVLVLIALLVPLTYGFR